MMIDAAAKAELPSAPVPAHTTGTLPCRHVVNAQPGAVTPMSTESNEVLRLRGGCGCVVGGIDVETG